MTAQPFAPLAPSPFHLRTARLCNTNAWTEENGWTKAAYYNDPIHEYWALRGGVGVYDLAGLIPYRVSGRDAAAVLDYVTTANITALAMGTARFIVWCDDLGHMLGQGVVYRLSRDEFRVFSRQPSYLWFTEAVQGFDAKVEDMSRSLCGVAVQGPDARALLVDLGISEAATLRPLEIAEVEIDKVPILVGRVSSSGELGYELFVDTNDALFLWDEVMHHRQVLATPVGAQMMELAMLEAGHPQNGVDYLGALEATRPHRASSPFELGWGNHVDLTKPHFVGRKALEAKRRLGVHQSLVGITYGGPAAFTQSPLMSQGKEVGASTRVKWSPKLAQYIGFAWILATAQGEGTNLTVQGHFTDELKSERLDIPISIVPRPFLASPHYRETPVAMA